MNALKKRICALLTILLASLAVCPMQALAAGKIMPDRDVSLTISYKDGEKAIPNASFDLYKVMDVDEYARMTITPAFEAYKNTVQGLSDLENMDRDKWLELAATLKGCVHGDGLAPAMDGKTDENGGLSLVLKPGLYLVIGSRATTDDYYTYTAAPFMLFLPGEDEANNDWSYAVTASPKFEKDYYPPDEPGPLVTRKVLKIWDDEGYETIRPKEVTVQLLCDGEVYDTRTLNKENNWRYAWDNLDGKCEWEVIEKKLEGYAVTVTRSGITFTVKNKYVAPTVDNDLAIFKRITGDTPTTPIPFTFVFAAGDAGCPMPAGSLGTVKELMILGAGSQQVGQITFEEPGTYVYTVREKNDGVDGYTYDPTVYIVSFEVTEEDGELIVKRTIRTDAGAEAEKVEFTNPYKTPENKLPKTGVLWWPVPVLLFAGLTFLMIGVVRRRRYS